MERPLLPAPRIHSRATLSSLFCSGLSNANAITKTIINTITEIQAHSSFIPDKIARTTPIGVTTFPQAQEMFPYKCVR